MSKWKEIKGIAGLIVLCAGWGVLCALTDAHPLVGGLGGMAVGYSYASIADKLGWWG